MRIANIRIWAQTWVNSIKIKEKLGLGALLVVICYFLKMNNNAYSTERKVGIDTNQAIREMVLKTDERNGRNGNL